MSVRRLSDLKRAVESIAYDCPDSQHNTLYPPSRPSVVPRPRLITRLNEGQPPGLTFIPAPAGFGKITLISEWFAGCEGLTAWLSLDEGDSDPHAF